MSVTAFVGLLGALLVLSYVAEMLFERSRVPSVVVLVLTGLVLSPLLTVTPDVFSRAAPYFGALALVLILFGGGLDLDLEESIRGLPPGILLAGLSFVFTAVPLALFARGLLGIPWPSAVALASLLGVPSSAVVVPLASQFDLRSDLRALVVLEAAVADVLGILVFGIALESITEPSLALLAVRRIVVGFLLGGGVALAVALLWSRTLRGLARVPTHHFGEVLTFGVVLLLDASVHTLGGASAVAVVAFGVLFANEPLVLASLFRRPLAREDETLFAALKARIHDFTAQTSFAVRTFFFVFLGLVVRWDSLTLQVALVGALFIVTVVVGRRAALVAGRLLGFLSVTPAELETLALLFPRGLVTAVLAFEAADRSLAGASSFPAFAFILLLATNLLMTAGLRFLPRVAVVRPPERPGAPPST